jgi:hypothetical protein
MKQPIDKPKRFHGFRDGAFIMILVFAAFAAWRFVFASFGVAGQARIATSPLPTGTMFISPTASTAPSPDATQITPHPTYVGKATIEVMSRETQEAALRYTPDSTVLARSSALFQGVHATLTAYARHTPTPSVYGNGNPRATPAGAGWLAEMIPPYYVHNYAFTNTWFENGEGGQVSTVVSAGAKYDGQGQPGQQGLVFVQVLRLNVPTNGKETIVSQQEFLTPTAAGIVHITGAVGEQLTLQSSNGTTFYFDVPSRQFLPSAPFESPIATPTPPEP